MSLLGIYKENFNWTLANSTLRLLTTHFSLNAFTVFFIFISFDATQSNLWSWQQPDIFDAIDNQMRKVTGENCRSKPPGEMYLPSDIVSQLPRYNKLRTHFFHRNRTGLLHLHNSALNRAFFHSFVLQRFNRSKVDFGHLPGWLHMYLGVAADVNANPNVINGSGLYFDNHCHYPNWINGLAFNKTLPLFAPVAWRHDDYRDSGNFLREPTLTTVKVIDWGAGQGNYTLSLQRMNLWKLPDLKPDRDSVNKFTYFVGIKYSDTPGRFNSDEFQTSVFYGPSQPGQHASDEELPVRFTQPYFDCGKSNQWVVSAVAPVIDYMSRYSRFAHIRRPRIVALISMDIYFRKIDFNACPISIGNPAPSILSGIDRCKASTKCKHVSGFGFKRGGYRCICRPGYRYPYHIDPPFRGSVMEQSTATEYEKGFQCFPIHRKRVHVIEEESNLWNPYKSSKYVNDHQFLRSKSKTNASHPTDESSLPFADRSVTRQRSNEPDNTEKFPANPKISVERNSQKPDVRKSSNEFYDEDRTFLSDNDSNNKNEDNFRKLSNTENADFESVHSKKYATLKDNQEFLERTTAKYRNLQSDEVNKDQTCRICDLLNKIRSVNKLNCQFKPKPDLILPGSVAYGIESQFEPQARTALRLAHFLSNYYQNADMAENFGILKGGKPLHQDLLFGEVLANVMADHRILSSGVFFDEYQFRREDGSLKKLFGPWAFKNGTGFWAIDASGLSTNYREESWFKVALQRHKSSNTFDLQRYRIKPYVRTDIKGSSNIRFMYNSMSYMAPKLSAGQWHQPKFRCDGRIDEWVITFTVPFFGSNRIQHRLQFLGVVMVDVPLLQLDITQCSQPFYVPNAFKNTHKCPTSTKCRRIPGFGFTLGAYSCKCKQGYEYPFNDGRTWIPGFTLEQEWKKKSERLNNRFDLLKCRVSSGSRRQLHFIALFAFLFWRLAHL